jgi:hypothetical protein
LPLTSNPVHKHPGRPVLLSLQVLLFATVVLLASNAAASPAARLASPAPSATPTPQPTPVDSSGRPATASPALPIHFPPPAVSADGLTLYNAVAPLVILVDRNPAMQGIKVPPDPSLQSAIANPAVATSSFLFTYLVAGAADPWGQVCTTFPENAKAALAAAAAIWSNTLQSSVPIRIEACWASLSSSSILGYSGGGSARINFSGAPRLNTWYDSSLANALQGSGSGGIDDHITLNSNFAWYLGTDSNPPSGQMDLVTVAAHEIAHGLNFSGSATYSTGIGQFGGGSPSYPFIYDTFMEDSGGTKLTTYANPSAALGSLLTSGSLWFDGTNANAANGGARVQIYAPGTWLGGSSYAHLDYGTFAGTINSLMVYMLGYGSANHNPGPVTRGILKDMGWVLAGDTAAPADFATTSPAVGASGQPTTLALTWNATSPLTYFDYCYAATPGCTNWTNAGNTTTLTLTGLSPFTTYYWQVRAWNAAAGPTWANAGAYASFTTGADTTPPSLSWVAPVADEQEYDVTGQTVQLAVTASDNVAVNRVVFWRWDYVKEQVITIATVTSPPYQLNFATSALLPNWNQVEADAYDTVGNMTGKYIWLYRTYLVYLPLLIR